MTTLGYNENSKRSAKTRWNQYLSGTNIIIRVNQQSRPTLHQIGIYFEKERMPNNHYDFKKITMHQKFVLHNNYSWEKNVPSILQ